MALMPGSLCSEGRRIIAEPLPVLGLPTAVLKEAGYQLEQKVERVVSRGRIIIQPSKKVEYDIDALVSGIHAGNAQASVTKPTTITFSDIFLHPASPRNPARLRGLSSIAFGK